MMSETLGFLLLHAPSLAIAIPLIAAFAMPLAGRIGARARNALAVAALCVTGFVTMILAADVFSGNIRTYALGAVVPSLTSPAGFPMRIIIEVDAFSALMAIACAAASLIACVYSLRSMGNGENVRERAGMRSFASHDGEAVPFSSSRRKPSTGLRSGGSGTVNYYTLLLLMTAGMLGLVMVGDLFSMFVFLELLSIASGAMIAFHSGRGESSEAALKFTVISSIGALMVLMATAFLYGQYNLLNIAGLASAMKFTVLDIMAIGMLAAAFSMKCGAFPMHMWVPDAYGEAPAPVSAVLVAASTASLYCLLRVCFTLFSAFQMLYVISWALILSGVLSMFVGVTMAIHQNDIKRLMAYHSVSQTGYILLGAGVGLSALGDATALGAYGLQALEGGLFHAVNNILFKGMLFLTAGAIFHSTGTRDLNEMGGLARTMPKTTILFIIGALAISGMPPLNGFSSKLMIYESVFVFNPLLSAIAMLVSILTLASFVKVFYAAFMGPARPCHARTREVPAAMWVAMGMMAALIIIFGLFPGIVVDCAIAPAARALIDQAGYIGGVV